MSKLWLVGHPTHQYNEDVKALARAAGLIVVDEAAASDEDRANAADDVPVLTRRGAVDVVETSAPVDRDALKAEAEALGITFAANVPTARLAELVAAKKSESLT
jgi:hypothetical protein